MSETRESRYVRYPHLRITPQEGGAVELENFVIRTKIGVNADVLELLDFFEQPRTIAELQSTYELDESAISQLVTEFMLVREDELDVLRAGLLEPATSPIGKPASLRELGARPPSSYVVLGAPVDVAAGGEGGARHGPLLVRNTFSTELVSEEEPDGDPSLLDLELRRRYVRRIDVADLGNVHYALGEGLSRFGARLTRVLTEVLDAGLRPLLIGGDHSITAFPLRLLLKRHAKLGILHFDAHHDMWKNRNGELTHANAFLEALESPNLARLHQVGLRTIDSVRTGTARFPEPRVTYCSARELRRSSPAEVLADLDRSIPWYLTFDVDCLTPALAGETGTIEAGGIEYYDALELVDLATRELTIIGADIVEVALSSARRNQAALVASALAARILLSTVPFEPLDGYVRR